MLGGQCRSLPPPRRRGAPLPPMLDLCTCGLKADDDTHVIFEGLIGYLHCLVHLCQGLREKTPMISGGKSNGSSRSREAVAVAAAAAIWCQRKAPAFSLS